MKASECQKIVDMSGDLVVTPLLDIKRQLGGFARREIRGSNSSCFDADTSFARRRKIVPPIADYHDGELEYGDVSRSSRSVRLEFDIGIL